MFKALLVLIVVAAWCVDCKPWMLPADENVVYVDDHSMLVDTQHQGDLAGAPSERTRDPPSHNPDPRPSRPQPHPNGGCMESPARPFSCKSVNGVAGVTSATPFLN